MMGTADRVVAYDNERFPHGVGLPSFWIDTVPVTNEAYLRFIEDGGYERLRALGSRGAGLVKGVRCERALYSGSTVLMAGKSTRFWLLAADKSPPASPTRVLLGSRRLRALGRQAAAI